MCWSYVLTDGIAMRIRFRRLADQEESVFEWRMAVQDTNIPAQYDLGLAANRVADPFALDHRNFPLI